MIRAECRKALADVIRGPVEALGAVLYRWPVADNPAPTRVTIVAQNIPGAIDIPTFEFTLPKRAKDRWRLEVWCHADADLQSTEDAEQLVQDLATAALQAVHADLGLGGIVKAGGAAGTWQLLTAQVVDITTPEVADWGEGPTAVCSLTVEFSAQMFH